MRYELKNHSFVQTIKKGLNIYLDNFLPFFLVAFVAFIPSTLIEYSQGISLSSLWTEGNSASYAQAVDSSFSYEAVLNNLVILITGAFMSGIFIRVISQKIMGKDVPLNRYIPEAAPYVFPLIGVAALMILVLMAIMIIPMALVAVALARGGTAMLGMGTVLLLIALIPALILGVGLTISPQVLVVEKSGIIESMKRSWELTKGKKWYILSLILVVGLISILVEIIGAVPFTLMNIGAIPEALIFHTLSALIAPFGACVFVVLYFNLRVTKEGFSIQQLAGQFPQDPSSQSD